VTWYELLTRRDSELRARGVVAPSWRRQATTGHRRVMTPEWARAIGGWGGVLTLRQIAEATNRELFEVRDYAHGMRLRPRSRRLARTSAQLAVLAYASSEPAIATASALGCLPVEVALGRCAVQVLLDLHALRFSDLLALEAPEVERLWSDAGLELRLRPAAPAESRADQIRRIVAAVESELGGTS